MRASARSAAHRIGRIGHLQKRLTIMSNKDTYLQAMKIQLEELHAGIDKLEEKTHIAEVMTMTARQREVRALQSQFQKTLAKLEEIKAAGETGWNYLKAEMEKAFDNLAGSLHDFKARN
jgi:hypothetical protein